MVLVVVSSSGGGSSSTLVLLHVHCTSTLLVRCFGKRNAAK